jgi:cytidyltransferase-like protein
MVVAQTEKRQDLPQNLGNLRTAKARTYGATRITLLGERGKLMKEKVVIYPGTFDPITNGHLSIIARALKIFDKLVIAILNNPQKIPLFSLKERMVMIREVLKDQTRVEVDSFNGLLVDYVVKKKTNVVIRGLRALSDFRIRISDGVDEPKAEQGSPIHISHDRLQMVLYQFNHHQGGGQSWGRCERVGPCRCVQETQGKVRVCVRTVHGARRHGTGHSKNI